MRETKELLTVKETAEMLHTTPCLIGFAHRVLNSPLLESALHCFYVCLRIVAKSK